MNKKMKIAFLTSSFLPSIGGSQIGLHNICLGLQKNGHKPTVFLPFGCYVKLKKQKWHIPYRLFPLPPKLLRIYFLLPNFSIILIKIYIYLINFCFKFDFWIANMAFPSGVILARVFSNNKKNYTSVLCPGEDIQIDFEINYGLRINKKIDFQIKKHLHKIDKFIALTNSVKKEFQKLNINSKKIYEIPYGVNPEDLILKHDKKLLRKKHNIPLKNFIFLCVGRNHPKKNFSLLNKTVNILKNFKINIKFQIIIIGKNVINLEKEIIKDGNSKYFILMEEIGNLEKNNPKFPSLLLSEYYNLSDCFLFPSNLETFGIVLAEAMIAGLPIITTDAPGCKDVVRENIDGLVFDRGDYKKAARLMQSVINNENGVINNLKNKSTQRSKDLLLPPIVKKYEDLIPK